MERNLTQLYLELGQYLKHFISMKIKNEDDVDDVFQEIFLKIHMKLHTLRDENKIVSWIFQIARNTIIDYLRKQKISEKIPDDYPDMMNHPEGNMYREIEEGLKVLINFLPVKDRNFLLLFEYEGIKIKDIAKKYNLSIPATKSRIQRARSKFKELVYDFCHFEFDSHGTIIDAYPKDCHRCQKNNNFCIF